MEEKSDNNHERILSLEKDIVDLTNQLRTVTREIEVENALEQLREKALEMRSSTQLSETSTVLFQQLKDLRIGVITSGVGIFDEENEAIELWSTSILKNQKLDFILDYVNIHVHPVFERIIGNRNTDTTHVLSKLSGTELRSYHEIMSTYIRNPSLLQERKAIEYFYSFYFKGGALNLVTGKTLTTEETNIMHRFSTVFGLIYTRFMDLTKAEKQAAIIEEEKKRLQQTLDNLKSTQSQLIQSEKMASLGELTAGIAHEIQNPLNFVNNFSEVNTELIDELVTEITSTPLSDQNIAEAIELAGDIKSNEEKIKHHGSRADSIVKGMLKHSRTNSGEKTPTDINAICDEYLRLAYHGLRAKDNTFNAKLETDFDESIGNINVVAQDISRVILNLITNAFQACGADGLVKVSTKNLEDKIVISVEDNGSGIPDAIKDKIFQPFFTTKVTGQGTGLGLSLAYDIVKAHGGELKVESEVGKGTEFIISLPIE